MSIQDVLKDKKIFSRRCEKRLEHSKCKGISTTSCDSVWQAEKVPVREVVESETRERSWSQTMFLYNKI